MDYKNEMLRWGQYYERNGKDENGKISEILGTLSEEEVKLFVKAAEMTTYQKDEIEKHSDMKHLDKGAYTGVEIEKTKGSILPPV